jgi:hypothetical protein
MRRRMRCRFYLLQVKYSLWYPNLGLADSQIAIMGIVPDGIHLEAKLMMSVVVITKGKPGRRVIHPRNDFRRETPRDTLDRLLQRDGLPERVAEYVYQRIAGQPDGHRMKQHWLEVMRLVNKLRPSRAKRQRVS